MDWRVVGVEALMVAEVLRGAADRVRARGWYQGRFRDPDSEATDATQALADAVSLDLAEASTEERRLPVGSIALLGAALTAVLSEAGTPSLAQWNDKEERTSHEVVAFLEEVATRLEDAATAPA